MANSPGLPGPGFSEPLSHSLSNLPILSLSVKSPYSLTLCQISRPSSTIAAETLFHSRRRPLPQPPPPRSSSTIFSKVEMSSSQPNLDLVPEDEILRGEVMDEDDDV
ncbi:hypothetical protein QYF36_002967 [Acer negundo]|nr:hypothetical protein QYF36_002967 [Acer negundo]